jgi:hypothetical protein
VAAAVVERGPAVEPDPVAELAAAELGPAAIAPRPLARPGEVGDPEAVVRRQVVIGPKWLSGREPVAVAAADPVAECRPAAKRGRVRSPATEDRVLGLDPEPALEATSAGQAVSADRASAIGPVAVLVSQAYPPPDPTSGADRALAADRASAIGPGLAADPASAVGQVSVTDLGSAAGQGSAVGRVSAAGQVSPTDRESAAGRVSVADLGSATDRVSQTGRESVIDRESEEGPASATAGAGQVYLHSLQGLPGQRWEGASPIALATVPLRPCRD